MDKLYYRLNVGGEAPGSPIAVGPTDTLKLSFSITEDSKGQSVKPHQTFLRFYDETTGEEGIQPLRVTSGGKAKLDLVSFIFNTFFNIRISNADGYCATRL